MIRSTALGGMIRGETYDWMEKQLESAWEEGAQVITVSHHNLLDQAGVSREFYDDCTIEHNEEMIRMLYDYDVRLHLSGHLHLQHYKEDEDNGISRDCYRLPGDGPLSLRSFENLEQRRY